MNNLEKLGRTLNRFEPLSDELISEIYEITEHKRLNKSELFVRDGEISRKIAINLDGLFRLFYIDVNGIDATKGFCPPLNFLVSYSAIVEERESYFNIEALIDSNILIMDYDRLLALAEDYPVLYKLLFKALEKVYIMKENREKEFLMDDATTRYKNFLEKFQPFTNDIKLYQTASYLGITPVALSRIRKSLNLT